jgi:hypothetical protein
VPNAQNLSSIEVASPAPAKPALLSVVPETKGTVLRFLSPQEYAQWDALVDISPQGSVFCRSWWIAAACGEIRILGYFENGSLIAGIPLYFRKRYGIPICTMPSLTHTWGVVIGPLAGKLTSVSSRQAEILSAFAERLADEPVFIQHFHSNLQNWVPFYWKGFKQTSKVTYVLEDLTDLDRIWDNMRENVRREIRKALKRNIRIEPCTWETSYDAMTATLARQGLPPSCPKAQYQKLCEAAQKNNAGQCFAAIDPEGRVHAAAFLVWDTHRAYYLTGGSNADLRNSGAMSLLLWHLIKTAAQTSTIFDFEGSMVQQIERFVRSFGARQVQIHRIAKLPRVLWVYWILTGKF